MGKPGDDAVVGDLVGVLDGKIVGSSVGLAVNVFEVVVVADETQQLFEIEIQISVKNQQIYETFLTHSGIIPEDDVVVLPN